jgi:hypothetical protein
LTYQDGFVDVLIECVLDRLKKLGITLEASQLELELGPTLFRIGRNVDLRIPIGMMELRLEIFETLFEVFDETVPSLTHDLYLAP